MAAKPPNVKVDKNGKILLSAFSGWVDVKKVKSYTLTLNKGNTIVLKFYDKDRKIVRPYKYLLLPRLKSGKPRK